MWEGIKKTFGDPKDLKSAFVSEKKTILQKLRSHQWASSAELEELLGKLAQIELTLEEVLWMLLDTDRIRQFGLQALPQIADQERNNKIIQFSKGKPEKARQFLLQIIAQLNGAALGRLLRIWASQKDEYVRTVSLDLLPKIEDQALALPIAFMLLHDEVPAIRLRALTYLASTSSPQALASCIPLVHDPEEEIRLKVVQIFSANKDERAVPVLLRTVRAEIGKVQETAIQALVYQIKDHPEKYTDEIIQLLSDSSPIVRKVPAQFLAQSDPKRAMRKFLLIFRDSFGWIRERALRSLKEASGQFVEGIVSLMEDPDPEIRALAENIGVTLEDPRVVPALIRLLNSSDWWFRYCAAETLARIKDPRAFQPLSEMLGSEENRLFAIEALGILKDPKALAPLSKLIPAATADEQMEIVEAFRRIGHPGALPYLKVLLEKGSEYVKARAATALGEVSGLAVKRDGAGDVKIEAVDLKSVPVPKVQHFLRNAMAMGASDFHMAVGNRPTVRINGQLIPLDYPVMSAVESQRMLVEILNEKQLGELSTKRNVDFCYKADGLGRFRTNVFVQRHGMDAAFRIIPSRIPLWDAVGLPQELRDLIHHHQGLILVTGPSGCGKTTSLAAFVDLINETKSSHVITIEDPIEYVHGNKSSLISQREVGTHTKSFFSALRSALREDPDVILVGEMRDLETIRMAVTAAETGHLVLSTLHTTSASGSIDRMVGSFPPEEHSQMRTMLSESLKAIISQVLLPTPDKTKLVPAFEILIVNQAVSSLIREGKTYQIPSVQQTGAALGMCLLDQSLLKAVQEKKVDPQAAFARAFKKELIEPFLPQQ